MLVILPLLAFLSVWLLLVNLDSQHAWRHAFLRAALVGGVWLVISTELLSLGHGITPLGLSLAWLLPGGVATGWLLRVGKRQKLLWYPDLAWLRRWPQALLTLLILTVLVVTALVAWLAPPNTFESLHYRMARVAHWAQGKSVAHFVTGIEIQNSYPPLAEFAFLHVYVLAGSDRLVNYVEWFVMVGCVLGTSLMAQLLGAGIAGQLIAALFTATLPNGIAQASSTMNEYVVTFWSMCAAVEFLFLLKSRGRVGDVIVAMSTAAGLALATKPIAAPYLLPLAIGTAIILVRRVKIGEYILLVAGALIICLTLNLGYLWRNMNTYHSLYSVKEVSVQANEMRNWKGLLSNLLRNAAMQASTPWKEVNYQLTRLVVGIHFKTGIDVNDPRTTAHGEFWVRPINTSDITSPNPLHAWLILLVFVLSILRGKTVGWERWSYQLLVLGSYVVFCYLFKWQIFGTRYLLPFFILYAPLVGTVLTTRWPAVNVVTGGVLLLTSLPWLFSLQNRPLVVTPATVPFSLLEAPREQFYFATFETGYAPYKRVAEKVRESGCQNVGLYLSGTSPEYVWWVLLGAPRSPIRIEWLMADASARYVDPDFSPCAIISDAGKADSLRGLPFAYSEGNISLYLKGGER
jgi:hypothetical protein